MTATNPTPPSDSSEYLAAELLGESPPPQPQIQFRWISDRIFRSIATVQRHIDAIGAQLPDIYVPTDIANDPNHPLHQQEFDVPSPSVIALMTGAELALRWEQLSESLRTQFRDETMKRLLEEASEANFDANKLMKNASWNETFKALINDAMNSNELAADALREGLPPHVLESDERFSVEVYPKQAHQVGAIVKATLQRLYKLYGADKQVVVQEISGWEQWKDSLITPSTDDIPQLMEIANGVRIPYEIYLDLASPMSEVRDVALAYIRKKGGFIHPPEYDEYLEMLTKGVSRMTDDGSAHYGILTEPSAVAVHLQKVCGFDPKKVYRSVVDLPTKSALGWELDWRDDPSLALTMFQSAHQVAWSVEVAVMREKKSALSQPSGKDRRNAGVAAALKQGVYDDSEADQAWVLTRHFQITKVGIPELGREPIPVSGAVNVPSDMFIRYLGGRQIGSAVEVCTIKALDRHGNEHDVEITIRWLLCLAPRRQSLDAIQTPRGQRG